MAVKLWCKPNWWEVSSFFRVKVKFVCGNCDAYTSTRTTMAITNMDNKIAGYCPHCCYWNVTGVVLA